MTTARDHEEATAIVAAGLCLTRLISPADAVRRAAPWILATLVERLDLPPLGVIGDLGALLLDGSLEPLRGGTTIAVDDVALAAARRRYEDAVLGRLAHDGRLAAVGSTVARLPREMHAQAVGILVAGVLSRIGFTGAAEVQPGVVRRLASIRPDESLKRGFSVLRDDPGVRQRLTDGYSALARCAQHAGDLIGDADLFALENLDVLGSLTQRLALVDVIRAQEAIALDLPRRVQRRHRRREGDTVSKLEDESVYPVGGFASVSTSGSLENLVTSELMYMDPRSARGPAVDLFDLRYVEGELMYYTRDEALFVRRRRLVVLALDSDLVRARVKDPALPWQRIVLVLGMLLVVVKQLTELLGDEALAIRVVFIQEADGAPTPLAEEKALTELMLRAFRAKGQVAVEVATWDALTKGTAASARHSLVELVRINARAADQPLSLDPRIIALDVAPPAESLSAWSQATAALLSALIGAVRDDAPAPGRARPAHPFASESADARRRRRRPR